MKLTILKRICELGCSLLIFCEITCSFHLPTKLSNAVQVLCTWTEVTKSTFQRVIKGIKMKLKLISSSLSAVPSQIHPEL